MRRLRAAWRLLRTLLHVLAGVAVVLLLFPVFGVALRRRRIAWWSARTLRVLGLRLDVQGTFRPGAKLIVANHVSWLDIMAIHALCPEARFVSKADVQRWPLLNRLVSAAGTLYIERERWRDALRVVHQMAAALRGGDTVAVFPEGTTGPGPLPLPFHANLLQAAIATAAPVQLVVLRFSDARQHFSPAAEYVGDTTLGQSLWRVACADAMIVHVRVLAAEGTAHADRRALAGRLQARTADLLAGGASMENAA
jgi:1-acyl-sn-glycerol-3-phosphate acyltransferase